MTIKPMIIDPRIDAYIERAAPFAQPILRQLREAVHAACPQVEESIRWSMPSFTYAGGILCQMAAFKQHASFGYWKHALVMGEGVERDGMGSYGKMASLEDIPSKQQLRADIRKAMKLNEDGVKAPAARKTAAKPLLEVPVELIAALKKNKAAKATFDAFPPGCRREYIEWISEAKRQETRVKRVAQTIEWLAEGKRRNWKYANC
ncbi:MAG: YdeI/OmpD-associated family protein [Thermomonas sp.]